MVNHLLGKTLVVDNIDNAVALQKKNGYSFHVVTKEGEYLAPGGSISGGAFKNSSNLLVRKREIEELSAELEKLEANAIRTEKELEEKKAELSKKTVEIEAVKNMTIQQYRWLMDGLEIEQKKVIKKSLPTAI